MNRRLAMLARVVLHPTYRGAGIAAWFIRKSCESCPRPWIETLSQMGHVHPFFEKAGFVRVGVVRKESGGRRPARTSRDAHSAVFGGRRRHGRQGLLSEETHRKSRFAEPVYYVFDNRAAHEARCQDSRGEGEPHDAGPARDD